MRLLMIFVLLIIALPALALPEPSSCVGENADGSCALYDVSLIELIANPLAYDGKQVAVVGYLVLVFEGDSIYLHREDSEMDIARNGLWVNLAEDALKPGNQCKSKSYVYIQGRFNAKNRGHRGAWSGALENVTKCLQWPPKINGVSLH